MNNKKLTDKEICPYCHKDNEGYIKMFGRFYLRKDHFNGWNLYAGKGKPLPIKFCPMCGRPLEIKQIQVNSIQDDFCGVPCEFMENKLNLLQAEYEMTRDELFNAQKEFTNAKAEAYKEFAEKLENICEEIMAQEWNEKTAPISWSYAYAGFIDDIDNLLKEMVGEEE